MSRHCYVVGCSKGDYQLVRHWKGVRCERHAVYHDDPACNCEPPFRLFPFPGKVIQPEKRTVWLEAIRRADPRTPSKFLEPSKSQVVCSRHFVDGRPSENHPYPELHLGHEHKQKQASIIETSNKLKRHLIDTDNGEQNDTRPTTAVKLGCLQKQIVEGSEVSSNIKSRLRNKTSDKIANTETNRRHRDTDSGKSAKQGVNLRRTAKQVAENKKANDSNGQLRKKEGCKKSTPGFHSGKAKQQVDENETIDNINGSQENLKYTTPDLSLGPSPEHVADTGRSDNRKRRLEDKRSDKSPRTGVSLRKTDIKHTDRTRKHKEVRFLLIRRKAHKHVGENKQSDNREVGETGDPSKHPHQDVRLDHVSPEADRRTGDLNDRQGDFASDTESGSESTDSGTSDYCESSASFRNIDDASGQALSTVLSSLNVQNEAPDSVTEPKRNLRIIDSDDVYTKHLHTELGLGKTPGQLLELETADSSTRRIFLLVGENDSSDTTTCSELKSSQTHRGMATSETSGNVKRTVIVNDSDNQNDSNHDLSLSELQRAATECETSNTRKSSTVVSKSGYQSDTYPRSEPTLWETQQAAAAREKSVSVNVTPGNNFSRVMESDTGYPSSVHVCTDLCRVTQKRSGTRVKSRNSILHRTNKEQNYASDNSRPRANVKQTQARIAESKTVDTVKTLRIDTESSYFDSPYHATTEQNGRNITVNQSNTPAGNVSTVSASRRSRLGVKFVIFMLTSANRKQREEISNLKNENLLLIKELQRMRNRKSSIRSTSSNSRNKKTSQK